MVSILVVICVRGREDIARVPAGESSPVVPKPALVWDIAAAGSLEGVFVQFLRQRRYRETLLLVGKGHGGWRG